MTRVRRRLIEDFLLPALNEQKYGEYLTWLNKEQKIFSIRWNHKNAAKWVSQDTQVFQDWDRLKGHFKPEVQTYYMQAKQRFRAALYKLNTVEQLPCKDKHIKYYKLHLDNDRKQDAMSRKVQRTAIKKENQRSIPTPVICKNTFGKGTELVGGDYLEESNSFSSSSISPPVCIKNEDCYHHCQDSKIELNNAEAYQCSQEYQHAIKRQRAQSSPNDCLRPVKTERTSPVLRESPQMNLKTPHIPAQTVPVYLPSPQKGFESFSPKRGPPVQILYKRPIVENSQPPVEPGPTSTEQEMEVIEFLAHNQQKRHNPEGVLNLSTRNDNSHQLR